MELHERGNTSTHIIERRNNVFTDADIERIVEALHQKNSEHWSLCRFSNVDPKIMTEAMQFYKNFNSVFGDSGKIIWRTVLSIGVGGFIIIIGMGLIAKIREALGQ